MLLKTFTIFLLFISISVVDRVSHANESIIKDEKCLNETIYNRENIDNLSDTNKTECPDSKDFTNAPLHELEESLKLAINDTSFPVLFSKYINRCMSLNEHKRAKDFFLTLAKENHTSPYAMTAKGIVTYGWWAENVLKHGLKRIDEAISLDKKAFFPRLCRAIYLSYLPEEFMVSINELNALLETEKDNPSNLNDVYLNLIRIYGEHGHYDMIKQINEKMLKSQRQINKKINYSYTNSISLNQNRYNTEIVDMPYPILNNTNTKKTNSSKDKHLNKHLAILEKSMERRVNNITFGDIYQRYVLLAWQYGEAGRAINFFDNLAKKYPHSSNVLAASGTITYGWRGQMLLQKGLDCIQNAIKLDNGNFFSRINHATFIAYFPNGFMKSMYELSLLRETEAGFLQRLSLINNRIKLICSQHGHDTLPTVYKEPVIKHRL